jgi:hypothetical protein
VHQSPKRRKKKVTKEAIALVMTRMKIPQAMMILIQVAAIQLRVPAVSPKLMSHMAGV